MERLLGELMGKFDQFEKNTRENFADVKLEQRLQREAIAKLGQAQAKKTKWRITGLTALLTVVSTIIAQVFHLGGK